jgi:hypothetical protein
MSNAQDREVHIADLAKFLDPEAFSFEGNGPLSHRREAALDKARNRVGLEASKSPIITSADPESVNSPVKRSDVGLRLLD